MSNFYGNILKHFQEAFSSFSFRNFENKVEQDITVNAENTKEKLILRAGDRWVNFSGGVDKENGFDTIVDISHSNPDQKVRNDTGNLSVINPDLSSKEGTTEISLFTPAKDSKGHLNGTENFKHSINLNIDTEILERITADNQLQKNIDIEAQTREANDNTLQNNIDEEVSYRKEEDTILQDNLDKEAKTRFDTDELHRERLESLENRIEGLSGAMHFRGIKNAIPEGEDLKQYADGDVIIVGNKEYVFEMGKGFVELGDTSEETKRIETLEGRATKSEKRLTIIEGDASTAGSIQEALKNAKEYTDHLANGGVKRNAEAIDTINDPKVGILVKAKEYTDNLAKGQVQTNTNAIADINNNTTGILKKANDYTDNEISKIDKRVSKNTADIETINDPITGILETANAYARTLKYSNAGVAKDITFTHSLSEPQGPEQSCILTLSFADNKTPKKGGK